MSEKPMRSLDLFVKIPAMTTGPYAAYQIVE